MGALGAGHAFGCVQNGDQWTSVLGPQLTGQEQWQSWEAIAIIPEGDGWWLGSWQSQWRGETSLEIHCR